MFIFHNEFMENQYPGPWKMIILDKLFNQEMIKKNTY